MLWKCLISRSVSPIEECLQLRRITSYPQHYHLDRSLAFFLLPGDTGPAAAQDVFLNLSRRRLGKFVNKDD